MYSATIPHPIPLSCCAAGPSIPCHISLSRRTPVPINSSPYLSFKSHCRPHPLLTLSLHRAAKEAPCSSSHASPVPQPISQPSRIVVPTYSSPFPLKSHRTSHPLLTLSLYQDALKAPRTSCHSSYHVQLSRTPGRMQSRTSPSSSLLQVALHDPHVPPNVARGPSYSHDRSLRKPQGPSRRPTPRLCSLSRSSCSTLTGTTPAW